MLKGPELLDLVKSMPGASKTELVRAAGYYSFKKDNTERLNFTAFYEALLEAKGTVLGEAAAKPSGRKLSFIARVQFNGNLMVGKAYIAQMGAKPGDAYRVVIGRGTGALRLVPINEDGSDRADEGADDAAPVAAPASLVGRTDQGKVLAAVA